MHGPSASAPAGVVLEICVEELAGARVAVEAGADRLELASALTLGGLTPSAALVAHVVDEVACPVTLLVRPRPGDFLYSAADFAVLADDVRRARDAGASGVAVGCLTAEGEVDRERLARLVALSEPLEVTFHRAFDAVRDRAAALEQLVEIGVRRVLTAGGAGTAYEGRAALRRTVDRAAGRLRVVAAGGVRSDTLPQLLRETRVGDVHASAAVSRPSGMRHQSPVLALAARAVPGELEQRAVDPEEVRALRGAGRAAT